HLEHALILLGERILRASQNFDEGRLGKIAERRQDRQGADEFGNQSKLQKILGFHFAQNLSRAAFVRGADIRAETHRRTVRAAGDDLVEAGEGTANDEENVGRVDLQELLLRMFATAL